MRRIVVGVDGSGSSAAALKWALRMARGMGSQVLAVYAIEEARRRTTARKRQRRSFSSNRPVLAISPKA